MVKLKKYWNIFVYLLLTLIVVFFGFKILRNIISRMF